MFNKKTTTNQKSVPKIPLRHPCTCALIDVLQNGTVGDEITNDELSNIAGVDIELKVNYLYSAIRYCISNKKKVWQRVRGEGKITCLSSGEILNTSVNDIKKVRRISNRSQRKLYIVDQSQLTTEQKNEFNVTVLQLGVLKLFGSKRMKDTLLEDPKSKMPKLIDLKKVFK